MLRGSRCLDRHRELAHVDTLNMSSLLRFGNFLQVGRDGVRFSELYHVFVARNHIAFDKFNSAMQTLKERGCAGFESQ